jgi:hypothetical protein
MAIYVENAVKEAMNLPHRLSFDDNNWARAWKDEKQ